MNKLMILILGTLISQSVFAADQCIVVAGKAVHDRLISERVLSYAINQQPSRQEANPHVYEEIILRTINEKACSVTFEVVTAYSNEKCVVVDPANDVKEFTPDCD